jgi:hypothetical protein
MMEDKNIRDISVIFTYPIKEILMVNKRKSLPRIFAIGPFVLFEGGKPHVRLINVSLYKPLA